MVLAKKDFSVTSDLTINNSHIPISVVINGSLTQAELLRQQEVNIDKVAKMYPMVDEDSLPLRVQYAWMNWVCQVPIFGVNSRKYNLNMVKYYFVKIISNLSDIKVAKKDNSCMFLTTPWFNPISAGGGGGGIHPPPGFSLAIATKINRSTPNFLTFNFYYRDII